MMSKHGDYLPAQEAALADWGDNFVAEITAHGTEWEIPAAEITAVATALDVFKTLHAKAVSPEKNSVIVAEKNAAREDFTAKVRAMVKFRFENPKITNADRVRCGLHPRDSVKTPSGTPATVPVIEELKPLGNGRVEIRAHDEATPDSRAIPYGCNGCLLRYDWGPEP
ncbi:MAG: hypothetical protein LBB61_10000, partial [Treponema sp.]|nr:hypothetical protein [Treponema sp.]